MRTIKVSLLGLNLQSKARNQPCLALYNLKLFSLSDPEIKKHAQIKVHEKKLLEDDEDIFKELLNENPDILALSCYLWSTERLLKIADRLVEKNPNLKVIVGGPDAWPRAEHLLENHDFLSGVVDGEGEESFRLLLRRLVGVDKEDWHDTPGLVSKKNGKIMSNPRPAPLDLDLVPIAIEDDQFLKRYGYWLYMETSRGCRYKCAYCCFSTKGYSRRSRSIERILGAVDEIIKNKGNFISFLDPGFNQDKKRFRRVLEYIDSHPEVDCDGLEINIEAMDEEDIPLLCRVVEAMIAVGLQTTNPSALKIIGRHHNPEVFRSRTQMIRKCGKDFTIDVICGLPGDNYEGFKKSIDDAYACQPSTVQIFELLILPGSRFEKESENLGVVYSKEAPYTAEYCDSFPKDQMIKANRFRLAHALINTLSLSSEAVQLLSRELNKRPSEIVEALAEGVWRKKPLSMEELDLSEYPENIEEAISLVHDFIEYLFKEAGKEVPQQLEDFFQYQFNIGRINGYRFQTGKSETDDLSEWPPPKETKPLKSHFVQVMECHTDIFKLLKFRPELFEVKVDPFFMLIQRTPEAIKKIKISPALFYLIKFSDGKTDPEKIVEKVISKLKIDKTEENKKSLMDVFEKFTKSGILIWK